MKLVAVIRPNTTTDVRGKGLGVDELRADILAQAPAGHELIQVLVDGGRDSDGDLVATGTFRPTKTQQIEADGADYSAASKAVDGLVPDGWVVLSKRSAS